MDNNTTVKKVWIPLRAQGGTLSRLVKLSSIQGMPNFLAWFNRLISDNEIPLSFDLNRELSQKVTDEYIKAPATTIGELMDWSTNRSSLFHAQRLVKFKTLALEIRDGVVGLLCSHTTADGDHFIPDDIQAVTIFPDEAVSDSTMQKFKVCPQRNKDNILGSCNIVAFICDPLF